MLSITERAKAHLAHLLANHDDPGSIAVRLAASGEVFFDTASESDTIVYHHTRPILYIDPQTARMLSDSSLDLDKTGGSWCLRITRAPELGTQGVSNPCRVDRN